MTTQSNSTTRTTGKRTYTVEEIAEILDIGRTSAYRSIWSVSDRADRNGHTHFKSVV